MKEISSDPDQTIFFVVYLVIVINRLLSGALVYEKKPVKF